MSLSSKTSLEVICVCAWSDCNMSYWFAIVGLMALELQRYLCSPHPCYEIKERGGSSTRAKYLKSKRKPPNPKQNLCSLSRYCNTHDKVMQCSETSTTPHRYSQFICFSYCKSNLYCLNIFIAFNFLLVELQERSEQFQCFAFTFLFIIVCAVAHANMWRCIKKIMSFNS